MSKHSESGAASAEAITQWLGRWRAGDKTAEAALIAAVYPTLRAMSQRQLRNNAALTLSPTELVHESYLRLAQGSDIDYANRAHFYALAATVIRNVLVDEWRERNAHKRGGNFERVTLSAVDALHAETHDDIDLLDLDRLLNRLAKVNARTARLVELRFFAGMSIEDAATVIGVSVPTSTRDWQFARLWLRQHLTADGAPS